MAKKKKKISKENLIFTEKVMLGFKMAYEKLVREAALHNESLVFGKNGKPVHILATQLLKELEAEKSKKNS